MRTAYRYWLISVTISIALIALGLVELMARRNSPVNWYLLNKSVASSAFLTILFSYILSAIHHFWPTFKRGLALRRPLGLSGYVLAVIHVGLTLLVADPKNLTNKKFPFPEFFIDHWLAMLCSIIALAYFTYAFKISVAPARFRMSAEHTLLWRKRLRYGYVAVLFVLTHATLLKFEGWIAWFQSLDPTLPPLSLIVVCLGIVLIALKSIQLTRLRRLF